MVSKRPSRMCVCERRGRRLAGRSEHTWSVCKPLGAFVLSQTVDFLAIWGWRNLARGVGGYGRRKVEEMRHTKAVRLAQPRGLWVQISCLTSREISLSRPDTDIDITPPKPIQDHALFNALGMVAGISGSAGQAMHASQSITLLKAVCESGRLRFACSDSPSLTKAVRGYV